KWVIWHKLKEGLAVNSLLHSLSAIKGYFQWLSSSDTTAMHGMTAFTSSAYVKYVNTLRAKRNGEIKPLSL
ncbi:site-specific integrase, partial [Vibrio anguillarum]|nr:site-specific integrase [Vibrio anguillarum]